MSQKIGLYHDSIRYGQVELDSLFVIEPTDYTCEPKGVITCDEVTQIAKVLRRTPQIETGVVGEFAWYKEYPSKSFQSSRKTTRTDRQAYPE